MTLIQQVMFWYVEKFRLNEVERIRTPTGNGLRVVTSRFDRVFDDPMRPGTKFRYETVLLPPTGFNVLDTVRTLTPADALAAHRRLLTENER